jgi:two-component system KDP operon response regulator KdpE
MGDVSILIVDNNLRMIELIKNAFEEEGWSTLVTGDGNKVIDIIDRSLPDLIMLNSVLPEINVPQLCRLIRETSQTPIIIISLLGSNEEKIEFLDLGVDDYIAQPFELDELLARARAVLLRSQPVDSGQPPPPFISGDLRIDYVKRQVTISGNEIRLTPIEYNLLRELTLNADKPLTYDYPLKKVWGPEYGSEWEYIHIYIGKLRTKIEPDLKWPCYIINIPGIGYRFQLIE